MANAFVHIELNTGNLPAAKKFYKAVFDWKLKDMPEMEYTTIDVGDGVGGGMQEKMEGSPTTWVPYVMVDDVKRSLAKAAKAGANVVVGHMPIGEMGAIGVFVDPTGAALGVWEMAKKQAPAKKAAPKKAAPKKAAPKKAAAKKKR